MRVQTKRLEGEQSYFKMARIALIDELLRSRRGCVSYGSHGPSGCQRPEAVCILKGTEEVTDIFHSAPGKSIIVGYSY